MTDKLIWVCIQDAYPNAPKAKPDGFTYRAKVPGGWLVAVWAGTPGDHGMGGGVTFLPDPGHTWHVADRPL